MASRGQAVVQALPSVWARSPLAVKIGTQFLVASALLALLLWRTNLSAVQRELEGAELWWIAPAAFFNLASDAFRAVRWRQLFRPLKDVSVPFLWTVAVLGVAVNQALPLRAGEVVRVQVLRRRTGLAASQVFATILSEKLLDTVAFGAFLAVGFVLYSEARFMWPLAVLYGVALVAGVAAARWLARRSLNDEPVRPQLEGRWRVWAETQSRSFGSGLQSFLSVRALGVVSVASVLAWACEAGLYYCCGRALGLGLDPAVYLLAVVAATVAVSVPFTQAGLGVFEIALAGLLVAFGVDKSQAAAFAVLSHVMLALPYLVAGPFAALALRLRPGDVLYLKSRKETA